ncbi:DUF4238 domain-containing protein [Sphingomonas sp. SAFR-052]|uniref:DUF4238 domain-containing protein n=1 Tax=Sphingomonas sp. SAFR-052 TaxID=3436867 RepID=UPI003F7CF082
MATKTKSRDGAQNQHYVPKLVLRNFLSNEVKEQVTVFDKKTGKIFRPNIAGVMAERRFYDFQVSPEYIASFEQTAGRLEDALLPTYRRILEERRLNHSAEEQARLAMLVAFQFLRTRQQRDRFVEVQELIRTKLEQMGGRIEDLDGYEPMTEDRLKHQHASFIIDAIKQYTNLIGSKHMMLISAAPDRDFYISDNPVVLHNDQDFGPYGNLGLGVRGIQIYLPLSHDLMLACLCPTILKGAVEQLEENLDQVRATLLPLVMAGKITGDEMRNQVAFIEERGSRVRGWWQRYLDGVADESNDHNMDFYNSLQMAQSRQFVISRHEDFKLSKRFMADFPDHKPSFLRMD